MSSPLIDREEADWLGNTSRISNSVFSVQMGVRKAIIQERVSYQRSKFDTDFFGTLLNGIHAQRIMTKTVHTILPLLLFCLSKTGLFAVISIQISSKVIGEVVYYLHGMPPPAFLLSMLSIMHKFRSK